MGMCIIYSFYRGWIPILATQDTAPTAAASIFSNYKSRTRTSELRSMNKSPSKGILKDNSKVLRKHPTKKSIFILDLKDNRGNNTQNQHSRQQLKNNTIEEPAKIKPQCKTNLPRILILENA